MRALVRIAAALAGVVLLPSALYAQVSLAGTVKDASGAVLPGVTVEASSPVLIEKTRTATSDATGQYRIESLLPGTYTITFTLSGFATLKREGVELSGTGVVTINADMKVGGVSETVTVTGETPVVDVQSTKREVTLDNETMRNLPSVRSYSYLLTTVPGLQTNVNNVNTGPVFAIFPVHGGRGVESRLTVDGLNVSNPPGGNQPPNYTADVGNAQEVTMTTSGGLGESETAGLTINIVPKQGGNRLAGLAFVSGFSGNMQSDNFTSELKARGATQPTPVYHVYDVNGSIGGPIKVDKLWYYMSVREQGQRQNTLNVFYNANSGDPTKWTYAPDLTQPAYSDRMWENYTPSITWQASARNKINFRWDEQPVCRTCSGTTSLTGSPNFFFPTSPEADGHGEFSPQRVVQGRWTNPVTNKLLLEAGWGTTYYQWGGRELDPNPNEGLIQIVNLTQAIPGGPTNSMRYRSQSWLDNKTSGSNWTFTASYVTGAHSMKFGYQGDLWTDDREMHVNTQDLGYIGISLPGVPFFPTSINEYINPYIVNANARQDSVFAQDQWTLKRLTLQGAVRWDHPWSWFPAQTEPASRFFPGASFARADGVTGYNDITPRVGAAYDVFGNGKTALKVSVGKYLQGASVSDLAYNANPALRIPFGVGLSTWGLCSGFGGLSNPCVARPWTDANGNFTPDCNLASPLANGECGQIDNLAFGSNQLVGAQFSPTLLSGWGVRPSDWSYGVSVQQEIFPRASVEVGYYRRTFTQYTTNGTVNDNLAVGPNDVTPFSVTVPNDPRLPNAGQKVSNLYNINPNVFGQSNILIKPTSDYGGDADTRVFNGVDVTFNVRDVRGFTFSGGTSTGKVVNDYCAIRAAVPENYLLNPYCHVESPFQTALRFLATYTVPRIDVLFSTVYQDKPNVGTDQLVSLLANYTLSAADQASAAAQLGRPMTGTNPQVNLLAPGVLYGDRIREWDMAVKKIIPVGGRRLTVGLDIYNLMNNNVTLAFNGTFVPNVTGWQSPTSYMNPRVFRLNAEFAF
ncbi:MAG TPA: carboxypeptidase regulatory-like domain-containing protein [Vicinamibacterales bacterium]|nr:carboxypeptidase regulatory-like domain-containing protein [Vicinamibacterales bacterium]